MDTEASKKLVREWVELWETGRFEQVDTFVAHDFVRHDPNNLEIRGAEAERDLIRMYLTAFPDLRFTIEHLVAEGEMVLAHMTAQGTHRGELLGSPPTDQQITVKAMELYRLADGKIAEQWVVIDALGMMRQLGAIPAPASAD